MDGSLLTNLIPNDLTIDLLAQAQTSAGTVGRNVSTNQWLALLIALAVLVIPFIVGNILAKKFRMPTYGTRFGWVLLAITLSSVVLINRRPGYGVDVDVGLNVDKAKLNAAARATPGRASGGLPGGTGSDDSDDSDVIDLTDEMPSSGRGAARGRPT